MPARALILYTMSKRRAHGEGGLYQRGDGRWVAQVEGARGVNGTRRYVRRVRRTQAEAVAALRQMTQDMDAGITPDERTTVAEWLDWWLTNVVHDRAPSSLATYRSITGRWIKPHVGTIPLAKLAPSHVQQMLAALDRQGLAPRSRQKARVVLVSALRVAERNGLVRRNAAQLVDGPRVGPTVDDTLTATEARAILDGSRGHPLAAAGVLGLRLGLRIGEVSGLRWDDIDFDAGTLTVQRAKTAAGRRTLPLIGGVGEALRDRRRHQAVERLAAGPLWRDGGYVFTGADGGQMSPTTIRRWWHQTCENTGVGRRRFHASRHTAATLMLADGVPLEVVSAVLGHASLAITADIYAKVGADAKRAALGRLDKMLG